MIEHYEAMLAHHGARVGLKAARKHLAWYVEAAETDEGLVVAPALRRDLLTATEPSRVIALLATLFSEDMERRAA